LLRKQRESVQLQLRVLRSFPPALKRASRSLAPSLLAIASQRNRNNFFSRPPGMPWVAVFVQWV
jgi:hypothetical protein